MRLGVVIVFALALLRDTLALDPCVPFVSNSRVSLAGPESDRPDPSRAVPPGTVLYGEPWAPTERELASHEAEMAEAVRRHHRRIVDAARRRKSARKGRPSVDKVAPPGAVGDANTACCDTGLVDAICGKGDGGGGDEGVVVDFDFDPVSPPAARAARSLGRSTRQSVALNLTVPEVSRKLTYDSGEYLSTYWTMNPYPIFDVVDSQLYKYAASAKPTRICYAFQTVSTVRAAFNFDPETECAGICAHPGVKCSNIMLCSRAFPPVPGMRLSSRFVFGLILSDPKAPQRGLAFSFLDSKDNDYNSYFFSQRVSDSCDDSDSYSISGKAIAYGNPRTARYEVVIEGLKWNTPDGGGWIQQYISLPFSCPDCNPSVP